MASQCQGDPRLVELGAVVRELRQAAGLSMAALGRRVYVWHTTVLRLERGQLRPRPSLLRTLAVGLDPGRANEIEARLTAVAAGCLAEDKGWAAYRERRLLWAERDRAEAERESAGRPRMGAGATTARQRAR